MFVAKQTYSASSPNKRFFAAEGFVPAKPTASTSANRSTPITGGSADVMSGLSAPGQPQAVHGPIGHGSVCFLHVVMIPATQPAEVAAARHAVGSPTGRLFFKMTTAEPA